jgi:hypothetical protein
MKYTAEQTEQLLHHHGLGEDPEALGARFGVPKRSIIAKLSQLGVYHRKPYLTKRGETPVSKEALVCRLASLLGVELDRLESLEKCNKSVLVLLESQLKSD